jgi:hypothetical protein
MYVFIATQRLWHQQPKAGLGLSSTRAEKKFITVLSVQYLANVSVVLKTPAGDESRWERGMAEMSDKRAKIALKLHTP